MKDDVERKVEGPPSMSKGAVAQRKHRAKKKARARGNGKGAPISVSTAPRVELVTTAPGAIDKLSNAGIQKEIGRASWWGRV